MSEYVCLFCSGGIMIYLSQNGSEIAKKAACAAMLVATVLLAISEYKGIK